MGINDHYEHGIVRGVIRYAKEQENWKLYGYGWMFQPLEDLQHWKGDGIIARIESAEEASRLKALRLPVVDVAGAYTVPEFSQVNNDDLRTGEKAAGYLAGRGFSRFAFCGVSGVGWSSKRKEGFVRGLSVGSAPALSSINLDCEKIGYEAAAHIHRIVEEKTVRREVFVPPGGIIERETTNIFVCDDPTVEQAVRFITSKAGKGISVADTANALFVSRRSLEKKFVRFLGKSVYTVILETRIGCAKDLLRSTGKTVEAVAEESGFNTLQRFYAVFARLTGKTPGQFRRLQREV